MAGLAVEPATEHLNVTMLTMLSDLNTITPSSDSQLRLISSLNLKIDKSRIIAAETSRRRRLLSCRLVSEITYKISSSTEFSIQICLVVVKI